MELFCKSTVRPVGIGKRLAAAAGAGQAQGLSKLRLIRRVVVQFAAAALCERQKPLRIKTAVTSQVCPN